MNDADIEEAGRQCIDQIAFVGRAELLEFAYRIQQAEREACAALCEAKGPELLHWWGDAPAQANAACVECATAIRQRGKP